MTVLCLKKVNAKGLGLLETFARRSAKFTGSYRFQLAGERDIYE